MYFLPLDPVLLVPVFLSEFSSPIRSDVGEICFFFTKHKNSELQGEVGKMEWHAESCMPTACTLAITIGETVMPRYLAMALRKIQEIGDQT